MISNDLLVELRQYIDKRNFNMLVRENMVNGVIYGYERKIDIENYVNHNRKPTFSRVLFDFIDMKSSTDPEIYKMAGIDRKHFSKIRSIPNYKPGKRTVLALALALQLSKKETDRLLSSAGYTLSESDTFDLVIRFCLEKKIYNLDDVNQALDYFSLKLMGGCEE